MLQETANAKINLFLDVTGRRDDGYHELHSCMQTVGLCDTISAEICTDTDEKTITLTCSDPTLPTNNRNLVWRAAEAYLSEAGIDNYRIHAHIEKRINASL